MDIPAGATELFTIGLSLLGTGLATWAAMSSASAAKAAREAVLVTTAQARAHVAIESFYLDLDRNVIEFEARNFGKSDAQNVVLTTTACVADINLNSSLPTPHNNGFMPPDFKKRHVITIKGVAREALKTRLIDAGEETLLCEVTIQFSYRDGIGALPPRVEHYEAWFGYSDGHRVLLDRSPD